MQTLSLQHAIDAVLAAEDLDPAQAKRIASDVAIVARRWLQREPHTVPARIRDIRVRIGTINPAQVGLSKSRFANICTSLRKALARLDHPAPGQRPVDILSPAWRDLYDRAPQDWARMQLSQLFRFADAQGMEPTDLGPDVLERWLAWRSEHVGCLTKDPAKAVHDAARAWNYCRRTVPNWPNTDLPTGSKRQRVTLLLEQFPASFRDDLAAFRSRHGESGSAVESGAKGKYRRLLDNPRRHKPLSQRSLRARVDAVVLAASALVATGEMEIAEITAIRDVVTPDAAALTAELAEERTGGATEYGYTTVKNLHSVACRWCPLDDELRVEWRALLAEVKKHGVTDGLTPKNRERLAQFENPANLGRLVSLPQTVLATLEDLRKRRARAGAAASVTPDMALSAMAAIAVLILTTLPVRRRNLGTCRLDHNIRWPLRVGEAGSLHFEPDEVKTRTALAASLVPWKLDLMHMYLMHYRPLLGDQTADNPFLFPAANGLGHRALGALTRVIVDQVHEHTGLTVNAHLFRHILGTAILRENPGDTAVVERLLGHAPGSRATRRYAEIASSWAAAYVDRLLEEPVARATAQHVHRNDRRYRR